MNSVLIECRLFRLWRWQSTSCSWWATHASHYSYAALASESFVPFPAAPCPPPSPRIQKGKEQQQQLPQGGRGNGGGMDIQFDSFHLAAIHLVSFRFISLLFLLFLFCFVYRFSFRFHFHLSWKIVRISCDINRRKVLLALRRALRFIVFTPQWLCIFMGGKYQGRGGVACPAAARVDWSVLISCLFAKPQKYLITCQKVCVLGFDMCATCQQKSTGSSQSVCPFTVCPPTPPPAALLPPAVLLLLPANAFCR